MNAEKPKKQRRLQTKPIMFMFRPEEIEALRDFCERVGRPMSWVVRDAVKAYLGAVEPSLEALRPLELTASTPRPKRGRPTKEKTA